MIRTRIARLASALFCLALIGCASPQLARTHVSSVKDDFAIYRITDDQAGHELVKTEQFLVPVGTAIPIKGLEFERGASSLTPVHQLIIQQIFNSLEEITENTVNDTNSARVAEFKKMEFEIRGFGDDASGAESERALAEARAKAILDRLTYLGTPAWRLKAVAAAPGNNQIRYRVVEFVRTR